ncbi:MAG TPA: acetyl-CoA hydrolase/transferase C-terminal domain-containing protein, partial [Pseudothermotoga sp.]
MNWNDVYNSKVVDIEKILNIVKSNQTIVVGMTPAEPKLFLRNLHKTANRVSNVTVFTCLNMESYPFYMDKSFNNIFENASWYFGQSNREAMKADFGTVSYVPNNLHQSGTNLLDSRPIDIFVGVASPIDKNGFLTLSASVVYEKDIVEQAKNIVLEVNPNAPRTHGDTHIHIKDVHYVVEVDYELPQIELVEPTETEALIAQHISNLIEDGSTIQLGIGGIPNAVAKFLTNKKDLGVHTEMFTESMIDLFESGVITNKKKSVWRDKFICAFAFGTKRMYQFVDDNPSVFFLRGRYVNDPYVICQNDKMVSINT